VIVITHLSEPGGDIGNCAHLDCTGRARHIARFTVAKISSHTWVCDAHLETLKAQESTLTDPDAEEIGKFQRPGDAAYTQRLAALQAYPATGTQRRRVLDFIGYAGPNGATDEEMQFALAMNPSTQRPRRVELVEGGWVEESEMVRRTVSKRDAVVWALTEHGQWKWLHP
jgi:hypothetical protein